MATTSTSTTTIQTTTTEVVSTTTTTVADALPEALAESVAALSEDATPAQVDAAIQDIADNIENLNAEQLDQIALAVSKAPTEVKKKFESEINIFGGGLDNYVPVGSMIPVGERRTLVIIGAVMTAMPVLSSRRK